MLKTLNVPMLVRNLFFMLVAVLCCDAQAELIGNIECGNNKSSGETIVCDYTIIGNKYKKLFDLQFSDDRSKDIAVELRSKISECDALQCVEALIDQQTALPVDITTSSTPIKPAEKTVSVLPELSTRQVEEFLPPILVPDEKSGVDVRGLLVYVPLAVIIVGIIFKFLSGNSLLSRDHVQNSV